MGDKRATAPNAELLAAAFSNLQLEQRIGVGSIEATVPRLVSRLRFEWHLAVQRSQIASLSDGYSKAQRKAE